MMTSQLIYELEFKNLWNVEVITALEQKIIADNNVDDYIHLIFLCWFLDLESLDFKHDIPVELLRKKLKIYYKKGSSLFIDDPRFLFYIGWMISITEWVFDVDDRKYGHGLIQRANALDPGNQLYLWGLRGALTQTNRYDFPELNITFKIPDSEFEGLGYTLKDYFNEMIDATNKRTSSDLGLDI